MLQVEGEYVEYKLKKLSLWEILVTDESYSVIIDNIVAVSFKRPKYEAREYSNISLSSPGQYWQNPVGIIKEIELCSETGLSNQKAVF